MQKRRGRTPNVQGVYEYRRPGVKHAPVFAGRRRLAPVEPHAIVRIDFKDILRRVAGVGLTAQLEIQRGIATPGRRPPPAGTRRAHPIESVVARQLRQQHAAHEHATTRRQRNPSDAATARATRRRCPVARISREIPLQRDTERKSVHDDNGGDAPASLPLASRAATASHRWPWSRAARTRTGLVCAWSSFTFICRAMGNPLASISSAHNTADRRSSRERETSPSTTVTMNAHRGHRCREGHAQIGRPDPQRRERRSSVRLRHDHAGHHQTRVARYARRTEPITVRSDRTRDLHAIAARQNRLPERGRRERSSTQPSHRRAFTRTTPDQIARSTMPPTAASASSLIEKGWHDEHQRHRDRARGMASAHDPASRSSSARLVHVRRSAPS